MLQLTVEAHDAGKRLDHYLQEKLPQFSRSRLQDWIKDGRVTVQGSAKTKTSLTLKGGEAITVAQVARPMRGYSAHSGAISKNGLAALAGSFSSIAPWPK